MGLGFLAISALDESSNIITIATRIQIPMDGSHLIAPKHVFGEATAVGISDTKSEHDYNYKTECQIWNENKEFERQNVSMIRPPFDSNPIGTNTRNTKYHIWTRLLLVIKCQTPNH